MHDNKEREWREHSFLTPTLLHHTPIATLCHPTPSFLPVLFLVYWIFLFSRPGNKSSGFVLWALFSMILIRINMLTCEPSSHDIALHCTCQKVLRCVLCVFAIQIFKYLKPCNIFFSFTLPWRRLLVDALLSTASFNELILFVRGSVCICCAVPVGVLLTQLNCLAWCSKIKTAFCTLKGADN